MFIRDSVAHFAVPVSMKGGLGLGIDPLQRRPPQGELKHLLVQLYLMNSLPHSAVCNKHAEFLGLGVSP